VKITASELRADVYRILDRVLQTGAPVEIVRHGKVLKIVPASAVRQERRSRRPKKVMVGDPERYVHLDWLSEWSGSR
jgi:prevent-host-death family protein